jgi:hypothetical protein
LVDFNRGTPRYKPEDHSLHGHRYGDPKLDAYLMRCPWKGSSCGGDGDGGDGGMICNFRPVVDKAELQFNKQDSGVRSQE